jgi:hypothetical protein
MGRQLQEAHSLQSLVRRQMQDTHLPSKPIGMCNLCVLSYGFPLRSGHALVCCKGRISMYGLHLQLLYHVTISLPF